MGIRSAREIQRERHALKALRGDFDALPGETATLNQRVEAVLGAVDK